MKIKLSRKWKIIITCFVSLSVILGALYLDYYAYGKYLFGSSPFRIKGYPLFEIILFKKLDMQREREAKKEEIEKEREVEEYIRNKKTPTEYLSLLKGSYLYFVSKYNTVNDVYINMLYEVEIKDNVPVLQRIDFIDGEKVIFREIVLNEQFDNVDGRTNADFGSYDFAFGARSGSDKRRPVVYFIKFLTKDGITRITTYINDYYKTYESQNIEEIFVDSINQGKKTQIQYTGRYEYEKIEIIEDSDNIDPLSKVNIKEINITFTDIGNLYMYGNYIDDNEYEEFGRFFYIPDNDNPNIHVYASDGGGNSGNAYYYFNGDYIIYHELYDRHDSICEYEIYYKKIANGT
jgi:hypothetical protein